MLHVIEFEPHYDAIIVGARCAGAATAMLLARAGLRVLAIDRQSYGSDTLSTHALMRPAVMQLSRWGLLQPLIRSGAPVIESTTFHYGEQEVTVPIRPEPGIPGLIAPRRTSRRRHGYARYSRPGSGVRPAWPCARRSVEGCRRPNPHGRR